MHGYWFRDYLDNFELLLRIDSKSGLVQLVTPRVSWHGYRKGRRYYAANLFCELNKEGKWAVDPVKPILYFWQPKCFDNTKVKVILNGNDFIFVLHNANYINFENLILENSIHSSIRVNACTSNTITGCIIRNIGGNGISLSNSSNIKITNCKLYNIGNSPIWIDCCGNEKNLSLQTLQLLIMRYTLWYYKKDI